MRDARKVVAANAAVVLEAVRTEVVVRIVAVVHIAVHIAVHTVAAETVAADTRELLFYLCASNCAHSLVLLCNAARYSDPSSR